MDRLLGWVGIVALGALISGLFTGEGIMGYVKMIPVVVLLWYIGFGVLKALYSADDRGWFD